MPRRRVIPGHGLTMYGNPFESNGRPSSIYVSVGHGKCKCGLLSPTPLPTNADRRDWWRSHVDQVAAAAEPPAPVVLVWDYGQQPDMDALAKAVREVSGGAVHLHQADTGSSDYALVIAPAPLTDQAVEAIWHRHYYGEEG